jgi:hypothetical protein
MLYELIPISKAQIPLSCEEFLLLKSVILSTNNLQGILMWEEFIDKEFKLITMN